MPLTHVRRFKIRNYECDIYGHVNNVNYLRYMQETAFDASAAAGYTLQRYADMGRQWWTRETEIEYLAPLHYQDVVQVQTWIRDFRRAQSRRTYEFWLEDSDQPVARATTNWAYVDRTTGHPAPIPKEMMAAFFPEGTPAMAPPYPKFPQPPPAPPGVFRMRQPVEWRDIDSAQHVNNAAYLVYVEACGVKVAAAFGWPIERCWQEGFAPLTRQHRIEYLRPALLGDELEISTWISDIRRATCYRHYLISRVSDGAPVARTRTLWVWVDLESGRPIRIPAGFLADFANNISKS